MGIGKIRFTGARPVISLEQARANADINKRRGLPFVVPAASRPGSVLAVVGNGPSITDHLPALKAWTGGMWAINGTWLWAQSHGIEATFFSLCCGMGWADVFPEPVGEGHSALITTVADPALFDLWADGNVRLVDTIDGTVSVGATTATGAPILGPMLGYSHVVFFGCESSYPGEDNTHAHAHGSIVAKARVVVRSGGRDYMTTPEFLMQAELLAEAIRMAPAVYSERSGGLLSALVADPDYDVVAASRDIAESLEPIQ